MMKKLLLPLAVLLPFAVIVLSQNLNFAQTVAPKLFAENVVNSAGDDYNPTFAPDGKTVYFTRRQDRKGNETIMFSLWENGKWAEPKAAAFSVGKDKEPMFAPDGKRLFFASTRPNGRDARSNFDIWLVEKTSAGWSEPRNVGEVNSAGYDNYPAVAADGTLYFASVRIDGRKDNDLYRSRFVNGKYQTPESLGDAINTEATEADPFVAPDQSYIIFSSDRAGGAGEGDLYVSFNAQGKWTAPQPLGREINTAEYEYTPLVSPNGKKFYFSRGWGDIYEIDAAALNLSALKK
jgi:Tol biopolymer transport system component